MDFSTYQYIFRDVYESVFGITLSHPDDTYFANSKGQLIKRKDIIKMNVYLISNNIRTEYAFKQFLDNENIDGLQKLSLFISHELSNNY